MLIKYDWPDMPIGTPMSFGGLLIENGVPLELSEEDLEQFKRITGQTPTQAARYTPNLTVPRKKVSN